MSLPTYWRRLLLRARNGDGGWPYLPGRRSRLEPTCAALLALAQEGQPPDLGVLAAWPRRDDLFTDSEAAVVNYAFNGLAGLTLAALGAPDAVEGVLRGLIRGKAIAIAPSTINRQDNALQAWPWIDGTFSWVEPTSWCLLGVKRLSKGRSPGGAGERIGVAERMLFDRVCAGGGWNHGNSNMLGLELDAYVPTTALALLALRDRAEAPPVSRSLDFLDAHRLEERSAMALALTRICLGVFGRPGSEVDDALAREWDRTGFVGNLHTLALALYALTAAADYPEFHV